MVDCYCGEIRAFGGNFAPVGWHLCNGALLPISQYNVLYTLIGTTYGGDGRTTFGIPDLRGRLPIHTGQGPGLANYALASTSGTEVVTLTAATSPAHTHSFTASTQPADSTTPSYNTTLATTAAPWTQYSPATAAILARPMAPNAVGATGGSAPHSNLMPSQVINFIIALQGLFPQRS